MADTPNWWIKKSERGLRGCTEGQHGPVKIILKDGKTPEQTQTQWLEAHADLLSRSQEQDEQNYTEGCPF